MPDITKYTPGSKAWTAEFWDMCLAGIGEHMDLLEAQGQLSHLEREEIARLYASMRRKAIDEAPSEWDIADEIRARIEERYEQEYPDGPPWA